MGEGGAAVDALSDAMQELVVHNATRGAVISRHRVSLRKCVEPGEEQPPQQAHSANSVSLVGVPYGTAWSTA